MTEEELKEYNRNYYQAHKEKWVRRGRLPEVKEYARKYNASPAGVASAKKCIEKKLETWVTSGIIPKEALCEACGKFLIFNSKDKSTSIHFDHRNEGKEAIPKEPYRWLREHKVNSKTIAIWKSCNFGILCDNCNLGLPTKDRVAWLHNITKYIQKT